MFNPNQSIYGMFGTYKPEYMHTTNHTFVKLLTANDKVCVINMNFITHIDQTYGNVHMCDGSVIELRDVDAARLIAMLDCD